MIEQWKSILRIMLGIIQTVTSKQHRIVKDVMEMYEETKKKSDEKQIKTRKPVNMQGKCDA